MKRKIFYMLVILCGLSIFSSANQNGKKCGKETVCSAKKQSNAPSNEMEASAAKEFNVSPAQLLVIGI